MDSCNKISMLLAGWNIMFMSILSVLMRVMYSWRVFNDIGVKRQKLFEFMTCDNMRKYICITADRKMLLK